MQIITGKPATSFSFTYTALCSLHSHITHLSTSYPISCNPNQLSPEFSFSSTASAPSFVQAKIKPSNWFGGEAFASTLSNIPAWTNGTAGFVNISTSDGQVHGVVKQAGSFSFVRIYESGHEVPFYQPLTALEMLNRTIAGYDIATGMQRVNSSSNYITMGPVDATFVEGNSTVTNSVAPLNATYNVTTGQPDPPYNASAELSSSVSNSKRRGSDRTLLTRLDRSKLDAEVLRKRGIVAERHAGLENFKRAVSTTTKKGRNADFEKRVMGQRRKHGSSHRGR